MANGVDQLRFSREYKLAVIERIASGEVVSLADSARRIPLASAQDAPALPPCRSAICRFHRVLSSAGRAP